MPLKKIIILICFINFKFIYGQNLIEDFVLTSPEQKVLSKYSKLVVLDSRKDTTNMGIIQKGAFNRKALLKPSISLKKQVEKLFKDLIDNNSQSGELLLNIREFKFAEVTESFSETGYCYMRADMFIKNDSIYNKVDFIDNVFEVNAMDVTKKNIKNGTQKLIEFISSNLSSIKTGESFSYDDILNIEFIEKRKIPVYNTKSYTNGVYMTFENFSKMSPSATDILVSKNKKGVITGLVWNRKDGVKIDLNPDEIFAVVNEGKIYVNSRDKFIPVEFKDDDFYFIGRAKITAKGGNVVLASAFFGILGGLIASDASADFLMKIDHLNGASVQIKQIQK